MSQKNSNDTIRNRTRDLPVDIFNIDMVNYAQRAHIRSWKDRCLYTARNYDILVFQHENAHSARFILAI